MNNDRNEFMSCATTNRVIAASTLTTDYELAP